jgi:hypothetical protein
MPELEHKKLGEANQSQFEGFDGHGEKANASEVIFPVMKQTSAGVWQLIGTGFFITTNGIFATAKHVLYDVVDRRGTQKEAIAIFQFLPNTGYLIRPVWRCTTHNNADVGIGICAPMTHDETGEPLSNKILTLTIQRQKKSNYIYTYAYPNTVCLHQDGQQKVFFNPRYYDGRIVEFFPQGRDRVLLPSPCYQTSMVIHEGASGGPVFNSTGRVCGLNSTGVTGCEDVSFISRIDELLCLKATGVRLSDRSAPMDISVEELARLGHIAIV